ncbi:MAG: hypothetical protein J7599_00140 [Niabella sp.]|nr:hypothetical protein [Niabella sp.]
MIRLSFIVFSIQLLCSWSSCSKQDRPVANDLKLQKTTLTGEWSFTLGERSTLSQSGFPPGDSGYYTDGAVSVLKLGNQYYGFWGRYRNYRTVASSPLLQDHLNHLDPATPVFGGNQPNNGTSNGFNDGGMWFIGVRQLNDGRLAGFFHAETHWYPRNTQGWYAYKSIGVAYSSDSGRSWGAPYQILKHELNKPDTPRWSGLGDGAVIYNHLNNKYYCYYTPATGVTALCMASSTDPNGYVGSWKKWYNNAFSEPGLGGKQTAIAPLSMNPGSNPSVHWNTYLNKFVMIWHGWDGKLYISASANAEVWETPKLLLEDGPKAWYPSIIGTSSVEGGQVIQLYYAYNFRPDGRRTLASRTITFQLL